MKCKLNSINGSINWIREAELYLALYKLFQSGSLIHTEAQQTLIEWKKSYYTDQLTTNANNKMKYLILSERKSIYHLESLQQKEDQYQGNELYLHTSFNCNDNSTIISQTR